jgi:hypothetical protein
MRPPAHRIFMRNWERNLLNNNNNREGRKVTQQ